MDKADIVPTPFLFIAFFRELGSLKSIYMQYNGLKDDLNVLSKFVFIYETSIKNLTTDGEFSKKYSAAHYLFNHKLKRKVKFATIKEIANLSDFGKYSLYFNKRNVQVIDFCRHLRNSFVHALLILENMNLNISDKYRGRYTSKGYVDYSSAKEFVVEIVKQYEPHLKKRK